MSEPTPAAKKNQGCLKGCLIAGGIVAVVGVIVLVVVVHQGQRIARQIADHMTGGGVGIEAPDGFRSAPIPLAAGVTGARSSAFLGKGNLADTRADFTRRLEADGWAPMADGEAPARALSMAIHGDDGTPAGGMTMDFFRKGNEVLMFYVMGSDEGVIAALIAVPEDSDALRR